MDSDVGNLYLIHLGYHSLHFLLTKFTWIIKQIQILRRIFSEWIDFDIRIDKLFIQ